MHKNILFIVFAVMYFTSCTVSEHPIEYDVDECHQCKMTISDPQFGCELVTDKGKVYKFDAIECMVREINQHRDVTYALQLVTDFERPKSFIDANTASFLISKKRPSPMGAYLSAYKHSSITNKKQDELGGDTYTFSELKSLPQFKSRNFD